MPDGDEDGIHLCRAIDALWMAAKHASHVDEGLASRIGDIRDECYALFAKVFAESPRGDYRGENTQEPVP